MMSVNSLGIMSTISFCLLLLIHIIGVSNAYSSQPTPSRPPVPIFPLSADAPQPRYAYVMMHYEGTPRDDEYVLGLRVLIHSLRRSGMDKRIDIVVILSTNVRQSTRELLISLNILLYIVPNLQNPFKNNTLSINRRRTYKDRFEYTFNKLYLWNIINYTRIIYLDSDNIITSNTDELFLCGKFCAIFMNPLLFHTGLMVIEPNVSTFNNLVTALYRDDSYSHDGADQGFLCAYFIEMERAPLFNISNITNGISSIQPFMRLSNNYNLNHFYYYINFHWDFFRRNKFYFSDYSIPGLTLAYPAPARLKPWYWFPAIFFELHTLWDHMRADAVHETDRSTSEFIITLIETIVVIYIINSFLLPYIMSPASSSSVSLLDRLRRFIINIVSVHPLYIGYTVGVITWFIGVYIAATNITATIPTLYGYVLLAAIVNGTLITSYSIFIKLLITPTNDHRHDETQAKADKLMDFQNLSLFPRWNALLVALFLPIYWHFIVKIVALEIIGLTWVGACAYTFGIAAEHMMTNDGEKQNYALLSREEL